MAVVKYKDPTTHEIIEIPTLVSSGITYYAGENINISSSNVISTNGVVANGNASTTKMKIYVQNTQPPTEAGVIVIWIDTSV